MRLINTVRLTCLIAIASPLSLSAQMPWEGASLPGPNSRPGVSLLFLDYGLDPNSGYGGAWVWRTALNEKLMGLHASAARGLSDRVNYAGGVDLMGRLFSRNVDTRVASSWFAGAGASYGEFLEIAVPVGIAMGHSIERNTLSLYPYISARAALEGRVGRSAPAELSLGLAIDVGSEIALGRSRQVGLLLNASLGDRPAVALGLQLNGSAKRAVTAAQTTR
jgi:hypothetical protein